MQLCALRKEENMKPILSHSKRTTPKGFNSESLLSRFNSAFGGMLVVVIAVVLASILLTRFMSESGILALAVETPLPDDGTGSSASCPIEEPILLTPVEPERSFYILIDRSTSYKRYTAWALAVTKHVLPEIMRPGDQIMVSWIGRNSASQDGTFCCESPVPIIQFPEVLDVPDYPSLMPTLEPSPGSSSVGDAQRQSHNNDIVAENKRNIDEYNCTVAERNADLEAKLQLWQLEQNSATKAYWQEMEPKFSEGPYDSVTHIREALYRASLILNADTTRKKRFLVIFSDLQETAAPRFEVRPDLSSISVIVVLHCDEATKCEELKKYWTNEFLSLGAAPPVFLQEAYPDARLINLLVWRP